MRGADAEGLLLGSRGGVARQDTRRRHKRVAQVLQTAGPCSHPQPMRTWHEREFWCPQTQLSMTLVVGQA